MRNLKLILASATVVIASACSRSIPETVPAEVMEKVFEEVKTPYKYGLVVSGHDGTAFPPLFYLQRMKTPAGGITG